MAPWYENHGMNPLISPTHYSSSVARAVPRSPAGGGVPGPVSPHGPQGAAGGREDPALGGDGAGEGHVPERGGRAGPVRPPQRAEAGGGGDTHPAGEDRHGVYGERTPGRVPPGERGGLSLDTACTMPTTAQGGGIKISWLLLLLLLLLLWPSLFLNGSWV